MAHSVICTNKLKFILLNIEVSITATYKKLKLILLNMECSITATNKLNNST